MNLNLSYDFSTRNWTVNGSPVSELRLKLRDFYDISFTAYDNGTAHSWTNGDDWSPIATLGVKRFGEYATPYLAASTIGLADGTTAMDFYLSLNTGEAVAAFDATTQKVQCMLEIQFDEGGAMTSTAILPVVLEADLNRGDEGPLSQANPDYPAATDVLTKSGNLSGIADPNSARSVLGVYATGEVDAAVAVKAAVGSTPASDLAQRPRQDQAPMRPVPTMSTASRPFPNWEPSPRPIPVSPTLGHRFLSTPH
jgi:hypothetical protein